MSEEISDCIKHFTESTELQSSGTFSLDLSRVELAFEAGADDCLSYWLRFAVFYGAPELHLEWAEHQLRLEFAAAGPNMEQLRALLLHAQLGPRYLGMGVLAALAQGYQKIVIETSYGRATFEAGRSNLDATHRLTHPTCRLTAMKLTRITRPVPADFSWCGIPVYLNGRLATPPPLQRPAGLSLILHGTLLAWNGPPLVPADYSVQLQVATARLDAMLRQLVQPALNDQQVESLQQQVEEQLIQRGALTAGQLEWLQLRLFRRGLWEKCWQLLSEHKPPLFQHCFAPAYYQRLAWLSQQRQGHPDHEREARARQAWEEWPVHQHWPQLLDSGCFPPLEEEWLRPTYRQFRDCLARLAYRRSLRHSWGESVLDADFLQALWSFRRDTLGGNFLLAGCLLSLPAAQLPAPATSFCGQLLVAALSGQEAGLEMAGLTPDERDRLKERTVQLCLHAQAAVPGFSRLVESLGSPKRVNDS